ncbi:Uncharacterised protein [Escherichia coli]|nr:Uncharacterised protein [Escherichia coli]
MVDRFLAALHGDDGRRHQQGAPVPLWCPRWCEQVRAMSSVAIGEGRRSGSEAAKLASSGAAIVVASHTGSIIGSKRFSNWSSERMAR